MTHFGQTPAQLTNKEHLPRLSREECMVPLCSDIYNISRLTLFTPPKQLDSSSKHGAVISVRSSADRLIVVHADLTVSYYRWSSFPDGEGSPFQLRPEKTKTIPCSSIAKSEIELRRKSFIPIPPIDTNMQRCPQVSLHSPLPSPPLKNGQNLSRETTQITMDSLYDAVEMSKGANPAVLSPKESTTKSTWNFFSAIRKSAVPSLANTANPMRSAKLNEAEKEVVEEMNTRSLDNRTQHSEGSVQESFDDCESDAEYEDDDDSTAPKKYEEEREKERRERGGKDGGDEGEVGDDNDDDIEISFTSTDAKPLFPNRATIIKELSGISYDSDVEQNRVNTTHRKNKMYSTNMSNNVKGSLDRMTSIPKSETNSFVPLEDSKLSEINSKNIALSVGELGSGRIVSCGYWDNALKVHALDGLKEIASVNSGHVGEIVCVQLGYQGGHTLITGVRTDVTYRTVAVRYVRFYNVLYQLVLVKSRSVYLLLRFTSTQS